MKILYLRLVVSLSLPLLVGCGGGGQMGGNGGGISQTPPPVTSFAESWHFASASGSSSIEAALTLSSSSVVGVGHFQSFTTSSPCPSFFDSFPLSGTIDGQGNCIGQVISGVWSCAVPDRRARARPGICFERKLSLHWRVCGGRNGHADRSESQTAHRTLYRHHARGRKFSQHLYALTQALTSDKDGLFPLAGTFTVANMCDETFTLNGASVVGDTVHLYSNTGTGLEGLTGVMDSEAQQIELDDYLFLGDCIAGAHGIITRQ